MDVNTELIRKFLNKECDPVEAEMVAAYLKEHPHLLKQIYNEAEWQAEAGQDLPEDEWKRMWQQMQEARRKKRPVKIVWYAAAACLMAVAGIMYLVKNSRPAQRHETSIVAEKDKPNTRTVLVNHSDTTQHVSLPDGTVVYLSIHSGIEYDAAWTASREIFLQGEAVFHVAKDTAKPFLVYCDRLSVQALGTVFLVNGNTKGDGLKVRLYEGKVLVKPYHHKEASIRKTFENRLEPGQELVLAAGKDLPYVHYFMQGRKKNIFVQQPTSNETEAPLKPSGWFEFRSQAVDDVFKTLEVLYGARITYNRNTVKNMFFIGKFEPTDSVEGILQSIALLNDLQIEKKGNNHYVVTRSR